MSHPLPQHDRIVSPYDTVYTLLGVHKTCCSSLGPIGRVESFGNTRCIVLFLDISRKDKNGLHYVKLGGL